jgi:hypothetical protein
VGGNLKKYIIMIWKKQLRIISIPIFPKIFGLLGRIPQVSPFSILVDL